MIGEFDKLVEAQKIIQHEQDVDEDDISGLDNLHTKHYKIDSDIYSIAFISLIDADKLNFQKPNS